MAKYNLPDIYIGEYLEYQQLLLKYPNRSTTGVFTFTSPTSNITYSTNDYPNNSNIYNRGELGMMNLLAELYGGPGNGFIVDVQDLGVSFALTPATSTSLGGVKVSKAGGNATVLMDGSNTIYVPLSQSGALTANNGLGVNVDGETVTINASNQLTATGSGVPVDVEVQYDGSEIPSGWEFVRAVPLNLMNTEYTTGEYFLAKPVYQKWIDIGSLPNSTTATINTNISNADVVMKCEGFAYNMTTGSYIPLQYSTVTSSNGVQISYSNSQITVTTASNQSGYNGYVLLQYIKSTDDTISTNPQIIRRAS